MTKEEIEALIKESLTTFSTTMNASVAKVVNDALAPIQTTITTLQSKVDAPAPASTNTPSPSSTATEEPEPQKTTLKATVSALQAELDKLKKDSELKEKKAIATEFRGFLSEQLAGVKGLRTPQLVKDLLIARWGDQVTKNDDGQWLIGDASNAKMLSSEITAFFATDEGKNLISVSTPKPTDVNPTNSSKPATNTSNSNETGTSSLDLFGKYVQDLHAAKN